MERKQQQSLNEAVKRVVLGEGIFTSAEKQWQHLTLDQRQIVIDHAFGKDNDFSHGNLGHWMKWDKESKKKLAKAMKELNLSKKPGKEYKKWRKSIGKMKK